ncbi:MAG: AbrB/MazE/SpoVT family DNA-binding domain-containing protein [Candidatus Micrarchaeota archaeon]|nr:AbrB/MazE/SpoVT family DNA-binding domain-containing protein [Candidatus Micrarchaeota archaeon]
MNREMYCPFCKKDFKMEEKPFHWGEGVVALGFECPKCGEFLLTEKEHRKAVRTASNRSMLTLSRKMFKLGRSLAVRIPLDIAQKLHLKPKQTVELYTNAGTIIVKPN